MPLAPIYINVLFRTGPDDQIIITPQEDLNDWHICYNQNSIKRTTCHTRKYAEIIPYLQTFIAVCDADDPAYKPKSFQVDIPGFQVVMIEFADIKKKLSVICEAIYSHRSSWPQEFQVRAPPTYAVAPSLKAPQSE
jgi:hypothetical protein